MLISIILYIWISQWVSLAPWSWDEIRWDEWREEVRPLCLRLPQCIIYLKWLAMSLGWKPEDQFSVNQSKTLHATSTTYTSLQRLFPSRRRFHLIHCISWGCHTKEMVHILKHYSDENNGLEVYFGKSIISARFPSESSSSWFGFRFVLDKEIDKNLTASVLTFSQQTDQR